MSTPVPVSHPCVSRMVGRLHVGQSYLAAVRYVMSRMQGGRKYVLRDAKSTRRYIIAAAIHAHLENRIQYRQVMARSNEEFQPRYFFDRETKTTTIVANPCLNVQTTTI